MNGTAQEPGSLDAGAAEDWRPRVVGSVLVVVPLCLLVFASTLLRRSPTVQASGRVFFTQVSSALLDVLLYGALGAFVVLGALSITRLRWRPYPSIVCAGLAVGFGSLFVSGWGRPHVSDDVAVTAPDGTTYRAGGDGDDGYWIVRDLTRAWDHTIVEVLASEVESTNNAPVIRPARDGTKTSSGDGLDIHLDRSGRVYVLSSASVLVAYDPRGVPRAPKRGYDEDRVYQRRGMTASEISPFAVLSDHDTGNEGDVRDFMRRIAAARRDPERASAPDERFLVAAFDDPNPWIAETARRFVREGGATLYPTAIERLPR